MIFQEMSAEPSLPQFVERKQDIKAVQNLIDSFPVTAILGPRQCGKTTLARSFKAQHSFDLENPRDEAILEHPQLALENLKGLIVIDEIQRKPDLFTLLRFLVDSNHDQKYLILGSASRDLIRQGSETLAGRIAYYQLGGFRLDDFGAATLAGLWLRGGLPRSLLARTDEESFMWRRQYISTFLERDIPQLGFSIPARTLRRFWTMLSHYHGQLLNHAELARSFGVSDMTVRKYCELLEGAFMIRLLQPWAINIGKRVVRRPKLYLRDSGLFHALMSMETMEQVQSNPKLGASWEGFALEMISQALNMDEQDVYFWRTHSGNELDMYWQKGTRNWGVEIKYQDAPRLTRSMRIAIDSLKLDRLWIVYPGKKSYPVAADIHVLSLNDIGSSWEYNT